MDAESRKAIYENAIMRVDQYIRRADDGTLELRTDSAKAELDPVVFADLARSVEETNRKIKAGELSVNDIHKPTFLR
jgi:hypothetical protein